jgi:5'-deoxy-5'-methylthioadenosine phosphorylase
MVYQPELAIIGGTGLDDFEGLEVLEKREVMTPYGPPSSTLVVGKIEGKCVVFLPRHGAQHTLPPHRINYRANLYALKETGVKGVIAVNAVGGIHAGMGPKHISIPDQIIDYSCGRDHTYSDDENSQLEHVDFTEPYDQQLRACLLAAAKKSGISISDGATYACTQGPRLETRAEIDRLERDGCDIVGMTGMPEAALARELALPYASIALTVNWAAGRSAEAITYASIMATLHAGMVPVKAIIAQVIRRL